MSAVLMCDRCEMTYKVPSPMISQLRLEIMPTSPRNPLEVGGGREIITKDLCKTCTTLVLQAILENPR